MAGSPDRGLKRLVNATVYSWQGLVSAFRHEEAFRLELVLFAILAPLAYWLGDGGIARALLIGSLLLVLIVEVINSAIEAIVDRIGSERHELSGRAKDMGSAAVFIALVNAAAIWWLVLV
ncbi:MAG: diacylglycerol kinase [Gammaproteobacteria bacterium]|nr:MAG: diacylglycerol kinase [Gammaproteobacteria bacterium]TND04011.1 MAG: diacylglycerol kinase [Gammaproteobacteria bacterium]